VVNFLTAYRQTRCENFVKFSSLIYENYVFYQTKLTKLWKHLSSIIKQFEFNRKIAGYLRHNDLCIQCKIFNTIQYDICTSSITACILRYSFVGKTLFFFNLLFLCASGIKRF